MNSLKALFLLFAILCANVVVARELDSSYGKAGKGATMKSTKGPKMSKKTKSPSDTKGSKLSTKSPTLKSSKSAKSSKKGASGIPTLDFNQFSEDEVITEWAGLSVTGLRASETSPAAPGGRAGVPDSSNTVTFTAPAGETFSVLTASMASNVAARPLTVRGFDAGGVEIVSEIFDLTNSYETYDLSAFANISELSFTFSGPIPVNAGIDNIDFA
eukprot:scaffold6992_cov102-Cylindrotheca_fusiformis.AAC.6